MRWVYLLGFIGSIVLANWLVLEFGVVNILPFSDLKAPAGVFVIGAAFAIRDGLRETAGLRLVAAAIVTGIAVSWAVEARNGDLLARIALASAIAFALSETLDTLVYEKLRAAGKMLALSLSNLCGITLDSILFLLVAFGSLDFLTGQLIGKVYMTVIAIAVLVAVRSYHRTRA